MWLRNASGSPAIVMQRFAREPRTRSKKDDKEALRLLTAYELEGELGRLVRLGQNR